MEGDDSALQLTKVLQPAASAAPNRNDWAARRPDVWVRLRTDLAVVEMEQQAGRLVTGAAVVLAFHTPRPSHCYGTPRVA